MNASEPLLLPREENIPGAGAFLPAAGRATGVTRYLDLAVNAAATLALHQRAG